MGIRGALHNGFGFDGSSVEGFARIDESDMVALPDPSTFRVIPWSLITSPIARLICDIRKPGGEPFEGDPRNVLKRNLEKVSKYGYIFNVGPELEFFYLKNNASAETIDEGGYFDLTPPHIANDNLFKAVSLTGKNTLVRKALGEHVFRSFVQNKKIEWDNYRTQVSAY